MPLADSSRLHVEEGVGHPAPQHGHDGLHIQSRWALRHRVPLLALKYGRGERHGILGIEGREVSNNIAIRKVKQKRCRLLDF